MVAIDKYKATIFEIARLLLNPRASYWVNDDVHTFNPEALCYVPGARKVILAKLDISEEAAQELGDRLEEYMQEV